MLATNAGVPQNIIMDMQNNLLTQATPQEPPVPEAEINTVFENLYTNGSEFILASKVRYNGPYHYHQKGDEKT